MGFFDFELNNKLTRILKMHEARIKDAQAEVTTEMVIIKEENFRRVAIDEIKAAIQRELE
jgi:hypothetical protein